MKIQITLLLTSFFFTAYAQQLYFTKNYDYLHYCDAAASVIQLSTGYMVAGRTDVEQTCSTGRGALMKLYPNGNVVFKKSFGVVGSDYYIGFGTLIKTIDSGFAAAGSVSIGSAKFPTLMKFNQNGDSLWWKQYGTTSYQSIAYQCKQTPDRGYILVGVTDTTGNDNVLLIKTDSIGNVEWQKNYGGGGSEYGFSVDVCYDGSYVIGGYTTSFGAGDYDTYVIKVSSTGVQQWNKFFGGLYFDYPAVVEEAADSGYVIGCGVSLHVLPPSLWQSKARIIKLSNAGNVLWDKVYGPERYTQGIYAIHQLSDGTFIAAGQTDDTTLSTPPGNGSPEGLIIKIKPNGDSIWYRTYKNITGWQSQNYLRDIKPTGDGGYVACGFVIPLLPDTGTEDMWVLKVDSIGCETLNCTTGINELLHGDKQLELYPNPNNGLFTLEITDGKLPIREAQLKIYNVLGECIHQQICNSANEPLDISKQPNGIYFVEVMAKDSRYFAKVIKQ
jgi:hypothetical protein